MIIDCIADCHGHHPKLEGGDLLIVAGDLTATDTQRQHDDFVEWLDNQKYKKKIFIGGNHDHCLLGLEPVKDYPFDSPVTYLCDSGTQLEGLKIWGSPWTLTFPGINPKCTAFTGDEALLAEKFALIPYDIDILVTHGPAWGILDEVGGNRHVGSKSLRERIREIAPKLHVFGHIHEGYGIFEGFEINRVNCSHVNEHYEPANKPIRIIL